MAQDKVTLEYSEAPLNIILKDIEKKSSFRFIYNNEHVDGAQQFSIHVQDEDVISVLDKLFDKSAIEFKLTGRRVILLPKKTPSSGNFKDYTISGNVKDQETGETMIGATLLAQGIDKGVVTNEYGFYSLTLPSGNYRFLVSFIGFESKVIDVKLVKNIKQDIELNVNSRELDEVVITYDGNNSQIDNVLTGVVNMKSADIKKLPALFGEPDITRAVLTMPGVSSVGEGASGFNVRGGNIDQNLILLDEAPVYNTSHVFGFFSAFNADAIKDLKLYKGGIPARYGGRASSVLDVRQREGSNKGFKGGGGLGLLFSRLTLEGPIKKEKLSFLVSGRRSYFDLFFPILGSDLDGAKVYFYDLSAKVVWDVNEKNKVYVSGYLGSDVIGFKNDGALKPDSTREPNQKIRFQWKNMTSTLRWNHIFSSKIFMNVSTIYSRYEYELGSKNDTGGGPAGTSGTFDWKSTIDNWILKPDLTYYLNANTELRFGFNATLYKFTPASLKSEEEGINAIEFNPEHGLETSPYVELERRWKRLTVNAGLRYSWFGSYGPNSVYSYDKNFPKTIDTISDTVNYARREIIESYSGFEPRLSLKYEVANNQAIKIGYNRMFQYLQLMSNTNAPLPFDIWKLSGTHLKPLEVEQFSVGYAYDTPNRKFNFSLEGYYKGIKNITDYINGANLFLNQNLETQLLSADGYAYGIESSAHKNSGKITGNVNYTYSVTRRKTTSPFPTINVNNGAYYPSNYDRPHLLNLVLSYKRGKKWEWNSFFTYQTGRPVTLPNGRFTFDGQPYLTYSDRNAYRIPDTHRLDISAKYEKLRPGRKWQGSWSFGVYNVYGNNNAFSIFAEFKNNHVKAYNYSVFGSPIPFVTYDFRF
ncbi:MAG: TonB-dependent receptor [Cyclobacteriaceae bacterium]